MVKNEHSGLFIVIEGLDGSGSQIQAALLAGVLEKEGYRSFLTKEPTNNLVGGLIRAQLTGEWKAGNECLQLLFTADRAQHLEQEILPALAAGKVVIGDRYIFSSIAYGSLDGGDVEWLECINSRFIQSDLIFLINVKPKICALRTKESHYEIELFSEEQKLTKVWQAYEKLAKEYPNVHVIDGDRAEMEILQEITDITKRELGAMKKRK